jgi:hypothetical protein
MYFPGELGLWNGRVEINNHRFAMGFSVTGYLLVWRQPTSLDTLHPARECRLGFMRRSVTV